jgi:signal transduction histidine kinase/tetratricopeptide (TPR) repeat protein
LSYLILKRKFLFLTFYIKNKTVTKHILKKIITTFIISAILLLSCNKKDNLKNNVNEKSLDQTFVDLKLKKYDTLTRKELKNLAYKFDYNNKKYLQIFEYIYKQSDKIDDTFGKIEANTNLGIYYFNKFQNDSAYYFLSRAEKLSKNQKGLPFIGSILESKADLLWCQKNFTEAESTAIKALRIAIKKKNNELILSCYITIANSLVGLNKYNKALGYYQKAKEKVDYVNLTINKLAYKASIYNYIALIYQKQNEHKKSLIYSEIGLSLDNFKKNDIVMYSYLTNTISYSKFKLGDKSSLNQFKETLKIGDSINSIPIQITSKTYLGEYYLTQHDTLTANTYLKNAQKLAHKNNIFEDELKILKLLQLANPKRANLFSDRYIQLNDSLQDVERATRDKFARIEFETDEITNQKEIVSKENNTLYMRIYIISGFGILSLLVIVLLLMNKSQKAKTRELLLKQEQQKANEAIYKLMIGQQQQMDEGKNLEKQRISLELHDGVMGKLSAVRLNLYAALYKANLIEDEVFSKQIDEIQEVEKEIRTIAHDLNSNLFSDNANFIGIVKELFTKIENHSQIHFNLLVSEAVNWDLISNGIKINLYRILQEALQNIEKYANAKNVYLIMTLKDSNEINIIISDDGIGFETNKKSTGIGIKNMKARMAELNGKLNIQSELNQGTKINLTIPF